MQLVETGQPGSAQAPAYRWDAGDPLAALQGTPSLARRGSWSDRARRGLDPPPGGAVRRIRLGVADTPASTLPRVCGVTAQLASQAGAPRRCARRPTTRPARSRTRARHAPAPGTPDARQPPGCRRSPTTSWCSPAIALGSRTWRSNSYGLSSGLVMRGTDLRSLREPPIALEPAARRLTSEFCTGAMASELLARFGHHSPAPDALPRAADARARAWWNAQLSGTQLARR